MEVTLSKSDYMYLKKIAKNIDEVTSNEYLKNQYFGMGTVEEYGIQDISLGRTEKDTYIKKNIANYQKNIRLACIRFVQFISLMHDEFKTI